MKICESKTGFTVVELIVATALIVVLLALLAPALDKAIYQAELTKCGSNLRTLIGGFDLYANQFIRWYPTPPVWSKAAGRYKLSFLGSGDADDLRRRVASFVPSHVFACPLAPSISLKLEDTGTGYTEANYSWWAGWQYTSTDAPPERAMRRLGDSWTWEATEFGLMASDMNFIYFDNGAQNSHPDRDDKSSPIKIQNRNGTGSFWNVEGPGGRGLIDMNAGFADGSVHRYTDVGLRDVRLKPVPMFSSFPRDSNGGGRLHIPPR